MSIPSNTNNPSAETRIYDATLQCVKTYASVQGLAVRDVVQMTLETYLKQNANFVKPVTLPKPSEAKFVHLTLPRPLIESLSASRPSHPNPAGGFFLSSQIIARALELRFNPAVNKNIDAEISAIAEGMALSPHFNRPAAPQPAPSQPPAPVKPIKASRNYKL